MGVFIELGVVDGDHDGGVGIFLSMIARIARFFSLEHGEHDVEPVWDSAWTWTRSRSGW